MSVTASVAEDGLGVGYVQTAMFTVLAWDFLICFAEELKVAGILGFCPSIVVYYMSRIGILLLGATGLLIQYAPISQCQVLWRILSAMSTIGGAATSFLFFLRVRAVYEKSIPVKVAFGIFWLALPVVCSLWNNSTQASHMGSAQCTLSGVGPFPSICLSMKAAYDTSVFVAITWRIVTYTAADRVPISQPWRLIRGVGMPQIYRDLLRGGQQFYFFTIGVTLMGASAVFLPVDSHDRSWLPLLGKPIEAIMACRVFRTLVLSSNNYLEGRGHRDSIMLTTVFVPDAEPT
ncbi:hypothetical protein FIBSPDRAFT_1049781 [Athelia psychrophila]|uniref:Transmembrane protein n=1 Tax=Athelia psychrophila TaxID=1759441 RepID=A0A166BPK6_9AGAM|nr:hypothetical protein FIBSPDRAFT_1049781 [Fibularhizoctonia sp. CBS 109695]